MDGLISRGLKTRTALKWDFRVRSFLVKRLGEFCLLLCMIICFIFITKQLILCGEFKENLHILSWN